MPIPPSRSPAVAVGVRWPDQLWLPLVLFVVLVPLGFRLSTAAFTHVIPPAVPHAEQRPRGDAACCLRLPASHRPLTKWSEATLTEGCQNDVPI